MPPTLRCPRNHPVPFTDDDRGGEVYCPVCGVVCSVPAAEPAAADPAQPLRCRNGHVVAFTGDDRGGEVYCRTCGVVCPVPEADPPAAPAARGGRVFSAAGESEIAAAVVGSAPCPRCEQPVPYTVADYGETVFCTRCGTAVEVGESLRQAVAAGADAAPVATATTPVRAPRTRRRARRVLGSLVLVGGLVAAGVFVTWRYPEAMPFDAPGLPWNRALIPGAGNAEPEASRPAQPPPTPPRPDERIKPEMIDRLLTRSDVAAALADAQHWADVLDRYNVPGTDPRRAALATVITALQKKLRDLRPSQVAATPVEQCLDWLDRMQDAIRVKDVPTARAAGAGAEKVMAAHPDAAARFAERYARQKAWLDDLVKAQQSSPATRRAADVERLLREAQTLAGRGKVTEALEARARALVLAPHAAIDPFQAKRLTEQVKDITTAIVRARGKRAVADAAACLEAGDDEALKVLVAEARRDLPEFTKEADFRAAFADAEKYAARRAPQPAGSAFGARILFRHDYERGLDAFREGNPVAAAEAMDRARRKAPDDAARQRLTDLTADGLEAAILTLTDGDEVRRAAARAAVDGAKPWIGDARWQKLDGLLRPHDTGTPSP